MPVAAPAPSIIVEGDVHGNIVAGDHNFVCNTNYGTIVNQPAAPPGVRLRDVAPAPPRRPRGLVGRTHELAELEQCIGSRAALVVAGMDGLGKTALVKQAANGVAARACPNGVVYLEGVDEQGVALGLADLVQRLFDALFQADPPLQGNTAAARTHLSNTTPLVVLDNLSLPSTALTFLCDLLPTGAVLITSPQTPADDAVESVKLGPLPRQDAIQLFAARAGLALDDANRGLIDPLCAALADVPLALVIAAKAIAENNMPLERARQILASVQPVSPDPLRAGIERSHALALTLLTPAERAMWSVAVAAPGVSVDRAWLEQVAGGQAVSSKLEAMGLVQANSPRLRVPPGLRAAGPPEADASAAREQLLAYVLRELATRSLDFNWIADELGNLLGLHEWAFAQGRWPDVIAIGQAIDPYLVLRGLWEAWQKVLDRTLQAARASANRAVEAWALHELGTRAIGAGTRTEAAALLKQALALRQTLGDLIGAAYTQHNLDVLPPPPPPGQPNEPGKPPGPPSPPAAGFPGWMWGLIAFLATGAVVLAGLIGFILATSILPTPTPSVWAPDFDFTADRTLLNIGECTTLRWNVRRGDWVELESERRELRGEWPVCPDQTTTYSLIVGGGIGGRRDITIVVGPTSIATDTATPTPAETGTPTPTATDTPTPTGTTTTTPTFTPTPTPTPTPTNTDTPTPTPTPTIVSTIPIGRDVYAVALSPDGRIAYVTDRSGGINVVDLVARQRIDTWQIAKERLSGIAVSPKGDSLYVSSNGGFVYAVSTAQGKILDSADLYPGLRVSNERPLVLTRDGAQLFVADSFYQSNTVFRLDLGRRAQSAFDVGRGPRQADVDWKGSRLVVPDFDDDAVTECDLDPSAEFPCRKIADVKGGPTSVQLSKDGAWAFITTGVGTPGQLARLDRASGRVDWLPLPSGQYVAALSPDETRLVAASNTLNQVFIIDVPNWRLLRVVPVKAWSIAISSDSQTAYAPDPTVQGLSIFGIR